MAGAGYNKLLVILRVYLDDLESLSSSVAEWEFLCGLGGPSRQSLVQPVPDLHGLIQMGTSNTQAVSANLRLRYNYRPDSDLYVIYNVGTQFASIAPAPPTGERDTFCRQFGRCSRPRVRAPQIGRLICSRCGKGKTPERLK